MGHGIKRRVTDIPGIDVKGTHMLDGACLFGPVAFSIDAGQWTCILGPSGAGKSTILRLIAGLETGGHFEGDVAASDGLPLAGRTSFMAQSDLLFPWLDILGNVTIGARLREEKQDIDRAMALIDQVGLLAHRTKKPAALSGGMRQRAALARTLMEDRPIVLLDEPFSALDARTRAEMQELAANTLAGRTVLLVTHDPAEAARLGHKILLLADQTITASDPPKSPPVRATDDPELLSYQAALLARLRGVGA